MIARFASIRTAATAAMSRGAALFGATPLETQTLTPDGGVVKAVLARGAGPLPAQGDELVCQYTGKLDDGTVFDSSRGKGRPFVFRVGIGQVISGWDRGMASMAAGERAVLTCTSQWGYGASGAGGVIPPNATLHFDVEVLGFGAGAAAAKQAAAGGDGGNCSVA